jgi:hypothetical protein
VPQSKVLRATATAVVVILLFGTAAAVIGTVNDLFIPEFYVDGWLSMPSTICLLLACGLLRWHPRPAFLFGMVGGILGLFLIAYMASHMVGMETGFLSFGLTTIACAYGLRDVRLRAPQSPDATQS